MKKMLGRDPNEMVRKLFLEDNLMPREIAAKLDVSLSTLYRWMDKSGLRKLSERGSDVWAQRIIKSKGIR